MILKGLYTALITPFDEEGRLDQEALITLVQRQVDAGVDGIICFGTTGEQPTLRKGEKRRILELTLQIAKGKCSIFAGTGGNCSQTSYEDTLEAKELGVDGALVIVPYYNRPNPLGCLYHFEEVAKADLPMILYYHPRRTGVTLKALEIAEICQIPQIIGIKECSGDIALFSELMDISKKPVLTGDDDLLLPLMRMGAQGAISVMSNLFPQLWKKMIDDCLDNDYGEASLLYADHLPLIKAVFSEVNPQGIKFALSKLGYCQSKLRLPLLEPSRAHKDAIEQELNALISNCKSALHQLQ